jgi:exportin-T
LTVTPTTVPLLFTLLSDTSLPIRLATSLALLRIVSKGLKEPEDKLQLIKVLSLGQVIDALETTTRTQRSADSSEIDEGEESYREALGRLLNVLGLELAKLADVCLHVSFDSSFELTLYQENANEKISSEASGMLTHILPVMLQFMADEYDDTCSTIFPLLSNLLSGVSTPLIARGLVLILSIVQTQSEDIV